MEIENCSWWWRILLNENNQLPYFKRSARIPMTNHRNNHKQALQRVKEQYRLFLKELQALQTEQKKLISEYREYLENIKIKNIKNTIARLSKP